MSYLFHMDLKVFEFVPGVLFCFKNHQNMIITPMIGFSSLVLFNNTKIFKDCIRGLKGKESHIQNTA